MWNTMKESTWFGALLDKDMEGKKERRTKDD
jgi:hypothetical protein